MFLSYSFRDKKKELGKVLVENDPIEIKDDVWIGGGVIITSGVKIGEGAVIGAGSVVTHDVEPYEVVAGNPANHIRFRKNKKSRK